MSEPITSAMLSKYIVLGFLACFGAVTHTLVEKRAGRVISFLDGLYLTIISGFASMMWLLIALNYFPNNIYIVGFVTGMGGYLSVEGLALVVTHIKTNYLKAK